MIYHRVSPLVELRIIDYCSEQSWSDQILKNEQGETCNLHAVWTLKPLYMMVYKMKVLTFTALFTVGYSILKMRVTRKEPEKDS